MCVCNILHVESKKKKKTELEKMRVMVLPEAQDREMGEMFKSA